MARKTYGHTDETYRAIAGREAEIAKEMECDPSYIYGIKNRTHPDPFPKFREIYRATAHGGGDTSYWREDLDAIDASVRQPTAEEDMSELLLEKVHDDSLSTEEIIRSIADGQLDAEETHRLIGVMTNVQKNASAIVELLVRHKARLRGEIIGTDPRAMTGRGLRKV